MPGAVHSSVFGANLSTTVVTTLRDATQFPFSSDSPFNTAIGSNATYSSGSDSMTTTLQQRSTALNSAQWSVALWVATSADPTVSLTGSNDGDAVVLSPLKIPANATTTGPTLASYPSADHWMDVIQPDHIHMQEIGGQTTQVSSTQWTAKHYKTTNITGTGINTGVRASKTSQIAGLIRQADLDQNAIAHVLSLSIDATQLKSGYVWPAYSQDGDASTSYSGTIPMGTLFAIPPSYDITAHGLSADGLILARALQDYGAYITARAGTVSLLAELACDQARVSQMASAWSSLRNQLRQVTNNSSTNVGGGGTPRQPTLPALM